MRGSTAGLDSTIRVDYPCQYSMLSILDMMFSMFVVAPCVVGYWRGTWELMSIYVYPEDAGSSAAVSLIIGFGGHFCFSIFQTHLEKMIVPDKQRTRYLVMSRIYTAMYGCACVNSWRGAWLLLDEYTELDVGTVTATTAVSVIALAAMRSLRNVSAPPFVVVIDIDQGYFEVPTMFRVPSTRHNTVLYLLDCLFSVFVIGSLVVFVWRGFWVMIDLFLFPENEKYSAVGSLIIGYAITILAFTVQPMVRKLCDRLTGFWRVLVADIFLLFSFVGTINVWRGIWNVLNVFYLPNDPELSCWSTHIVFLIILFVLKCANSVLVRGVYIDAEEPAGKCVVFPIYYLRSYFQHTKIKSSSHVATIKLSPIPEADPMVTGEANHVIVPLIPQSEMNLEDGVTNKCDASEKRLEEV